ncbi:MAG: cyclodeaminase/cyclohydrolase family protein [Candidatus Eremiobacteraeota bacterium]|nr:cyclodeaminase/cyclohydrolase family protein [Candidatus Eremiobacteraeota bacterium]MBV8375105.1 cyclodeaminase/cyclohydrolase family protein [Candidatus Eremiobacteraeota bacterium]
METLERYLGQLASTQPTPGGGSAATIVAAVGAALVAMAARISAGNPKYAAYRETALRVASESDAVRTSLVLARERDERAFAAVVAAQGARAREAALHAAAEAPLDAAKDCTRVLRLAASALEVPNRNLASDIGCAAEFGFAALAACAYNVRINHRYMRDAAAIERQAARLTQYERDGAALLEMVREGVRRLLEA